MNLIYEMKEAGFSMDTIKFTKEARNFTIRLEKNSNSYLNIRINSDVYKKNKYDEQRYAYKKIEVINYVHFLRNLCHNVKHFNHDICESWFGDFNYYVSFGFTIDDDAVILEVAKFLYEKLNEYFLKCKEPKKDDIGILKSWFVK
jgi:hypothetical protein